jgi:hypothetical protein
MEEIILEQGGVLTPGEGPRIGRLSQDWQHIWLYEEDISNLKTLGEWEVLEAIQMKLRGEPLSVFGIEISHTPGSGKLAVDFAQTCSDRWPCVVMKDQPTETESDYIKVFDKQDILQLQKEGRGFIRYGME